MVEGVRFTLHLDIGDIFLRLVQFFECMVSFESKGTCTSLLPIGERLWICC